VQNSGHHGHDQYRLTTSVVVMRRFTVSCDFPQEASGYTDDLAEEHAGTPIKRKKYGGHPADSATANIH